MVPMRGPKLRDSSERFWNLVNKTDSCWLWNGGKTISGYGVFRLSNPRSLIMAHRFSYEELHGPIAEGLAIDHLCMNKPCVRPLHLEAVTPRVNNQRYAATITHCPYGHLYSLENTYVRTSGKRNCRTCHRIEETNRRNGKSETRPQKLSRRERYDFRRQTSSD